MTNNINNFVNNNMPVNMPNKNERTVGRPANENVKRKRNEVPDKINNPNILNKDSLNEKSNNQNFSKQVNYDINYGPKDSKEKSNLKQQNINNDQNKKIVQQDKN